jgi:hypothetical protein
VSWSDTSPTVCKSIFTPALAIEAHLEFEHKEETNWHSRAKIERKETA